MYGLELTEDSIAAIGPMAEMRYGGEYGTPCSTTVLPTHLIPVVAITRSPWIVIASAPPAHSALTTAWMSCWWTSSSLTSSPAAWSASSGASSRVIVTPGPVTGFRAGGAPGRVGA